MKNDVAEGGIINKEIGRIFQRIRKISDEDEELDSAEDTTLGHSRLDRKGR